jgi:hypothetical protein
MWSGRRRCRGEFGVRCHVDVDVRALVQINGLALHTIFHRSSRNRTRIGVEPPYTLLSSFLPCLPQLRDALAEPLILAVPW